MVIVLEGLPASGKTTLANNLRDQLGFMKVNESSGRLGDTAHHGSQKRIFDDVVARYRNARAAERHVVIDRGYPSLLAWDYCAEKLGSASNLCEKLRWVAEALQTGALFEPTWYIVLEISPKLSLLRRPRLESSEDVWSGLPGMQACSAFYKQFFASQKRAVNVVWLDASRSADTVLDYVSRITKNL